MLIRHGISIFVAGVAAFLAYKVSLNVWFNNTFPLWIMTILLLAVVLVAGTEVNGSTRWIRIARFYLAGLGSGQGHDGHLYCGLCGTTGKRGCEAVHPAYTAWSA